MARLRDLAGLGQAIERGQHEGRGLAGSGLGDPKQVAAGKNGRNGLQLDRGRLRIIFRGERIEEGLGQPQRMKGHENSNIKMAARIARSKGVKKAPRVNWRAKSIETRAGSSFLSRPFTPL